MKTLIFTTLFLICSTVLVQAQNQLIVDRNPNGIGQYTSISTAISAAAAGDIILVIPSTESYGSVTINKSNLTIAGGGANGQLGEYTEFDNVSVSSNLENIVLGGFRCDALTATGGINKIRDLNIQGVYVNGKAEFSSVDTLKIGFTFAQQFKISGSTQVVMEQSELQVTGNNNFTLASGAPLDIATTTNFIVQNSLIKANGITVDNGSIGLFNNNSVDTYASGGTYNFGGSVNVTNNIFMDNSTASWAQSLTVSGGSVYQNNMFWNLDNTYALANPIGTITTTQSENAFGNFRGSTRIWNDNDKLTVAEGAVSENAGTGVDGKDGTAADLGAYGGLSPMASEIPSTAKGITVVPSITSIQLSLPNAASGGSVILNVTGQAKRN